MSTYNIVQARKTRLELPITASDTTITLAGFYDLYGNALTMSDFGDIGYGTIEPGSSDAQEIISFTGITNNGDGTFAITGVVRGLRGKPPYTTGGTAYAHGSNVIFVISNNPQVYQKYLNVENGGTVNGLVNFATTPKSTAGNPTDPTHFTIKSYVDALVLGTLTTINVIVPGTAGETVVAGNLVYFDDTDNEWKKCDADTAATVNNVLLGIAQGAGTDGNSITDGVLLQGVDDNQSGLTNGQTYYASNTAGGVSSSAGTNEVTVGIGKSATELYFKARFNQELTENQQDILEAIEAGNDFYGASSGGTDAYAITVPHTVAYANGMRFRFKADVGNTTAATLNVNGLGAITIKKNHDQDLETGDIEANQIVEVIYNSTGPVMEMTSQSAIVKTVDIQTFTADGTWTKPSGAKTVVVECIGGGGSGAGGAGITAGNYATGGSGGGGGALARRTFQASDLAATVAILVAVAKAGGAGGSSADGTSGTAGDPSSFGTHLYGHGGGAGYKGTFGAGAQTEKSGGGGGGTGGAGNIGVDNGDSTGGFPAITAGVGGQGGAGAGAASTGKSAEYGGGGGGQGSDNNAGGAGGSSLYGAGGGGGGGGKLDSGTETAGGAGGNTNAYAVGGGGAAGAANGGAGTAGSAGTSLKLGTGGGGGGGQGSGTGGAGADGGAPGGGGGGGGGGTPTGGAGGAGARGEVRVTTYF